MLPAVRRGFLGGTFDPPHLAHLVAAEAAYRQLGVDVVSFVPAGAPWQKVNMSVTAAEHRLRMTELATGGVRYFDVDEREIRRDGWTYTVDTLATYPVSDEVTVLVGADAARDVPSWHRAADLMATASFAVVPRPGVAREDVDAALAGADVAWLDMPELGISSTDLRRRVRRGASVRFLIPETVRSYIERHGLYREE